MIEIDWAAQAGHLRHTATDEASWYDLVASGLVRRTDKLAVDVGCGGGGMAKALASAMPTGASVVAIDADAEVLEQAREHTAGTAVRCELVSMDDGPEPLRAAIGAPADLIWASASVHHAADQQAAIDALVSLLAPGGRLALAEGGLPARSLPWDLGIGEPGLELRLDVAQDRWFKVMRESLPGSVPMPYGWTDALQRAGLTGVTTKSVLTEKPVPLSDEDRDRVVAQFQLRVDRLTPGAEVGSGHGHGQAPEPGHGDGNDHGNEPGHHRGHGQSRGHNHGQSHGDKHGQSHGDGLPEALSLPPEDLAVWKELLDPDSEHYLGRRTDLAALSVRSIHLGELG